MCCLNVKNGILCIRYGSFCFRHLKRQGFHAKIKSQRGDVLKIAINIDERITDTEITVSCGKLTTDVERLIAAIRILDRQITVTKDDESYILDVSEIVYAESVDRRTFIYTADDCFESGLKLYEIEEQLCNIGFVRASKSCLIHLKYVRSLKAEINRKIRVTLENGEQIIVSRQYADELKRKLGVK